jgi:PAS domain S-box-containing protein
MTRLLVIDDEPDLVRVVARALAADGHEVATALSGPEGLAAFEAAPAAIVVTDIKMPGMDGIEVLKRVKARAPGAEVVIITGHGDVDLAVEALHFGASDFIAKPFRHETLAIALRRAEEKIAIRRQLAEYTQGLESRIAEATAELRRRSGFLANLIRSSNDGIVATDESLTIVVFNPEAERMLGYRQPEVLHRRRLTELLPPELAGFFEGAMGAAPGSARELPWTETELAAADGSRVPVRFSGSLLVEGDRKAGAVAFFQDLREIRRLQRELLRSERLAAIGQTVAGVAHGIKNILHGLKGGSYLLDVGFARQDEQKLRKGWDMIKRSVERTSNLVMDLLSYSKEREPEIVACAPNEIAAEVCELVGERAAQGGVAIARELDPAVGTVCMDPQTLHTCLLNLVSNALDACLWDEPGAKRWQVTVRTAVEPGERLRVEVVDNGAGMTDDVRAKLFTSFFSTKGHQGTGLGLMVTRKLVEEHGGTIDVRSALGQGTTFTVRLPFRPECPATPAPVKEGG